MDSKKKTALEVLEAIGQENEKEGIKATKYFVDQFDRAEWNKQQIKKDKLAKGRFTKKKYYEMLASMLHEEAQDLDIPVFYRVWAMPTDKGVVLNLTDRYKRKYYKAFTPIGEPKKDYAAVIHVLVSAQNQIDELEQRFISGEEKTKTGIYL